MANFQKDDNWDTPLNNAGYAVEVIGSTAEGIESGIKKLQTNRNKIDPHLKTKVLSQTVKIAKGINKVALPVAVTLDAVDFGTAIAEDKKQGTTRNMVESAAGIAGGWSGGFAGAAIGAAAGTAVCPGIGTGIGAFGGGVVGGIGGAVAAAKAAERIGDAVDYDIIEKTCKKCKAKFKVRKYLGEKYVEFCPNCAGF